MRLTWHLLDARLGDTSPWSAPLGHAEVCALTVAVADPERAGIWRAAEHGEQVSRGSGFHAEVASHPEGDTVLVYFDGRLRQERVRVAFAVPER
jgi:hypothetical protein